MATMMMPLRIRMRRISIAHVAVDEGLPGADWPPLRWGAGEAVQPTTGIAGAALGGT